MEAVGRGEAEAQAEPPGAAGVSEGGALSEGRGEEDSEAVARGVRVPCSAPAAPGEGEGEGRALPLPCAVPEAEAEASAVMGVERGEAEAVPPPPPLLHVPVAEISVLAEGLGGVEGEGVTVPPARGAPLLLRADVDSTMGREASSLGPRLARSKRQRYKKCTHRRQLCCARARCRWGRF